MDSGRRICLGAIVGVHGIKGEVKVKSFTESERNLERYGVLEDQHGRSWEVKVSGHSKELLRVKIKGIDDRNAAKELIGCRLYADRSALPELKSEDEFYQADLIGLEVRLADGSRLEMIPFTRAYVPEVNIKDGYIIVSSVSMQFDEDDGDDGAEA